MSQGIGPLDPGKPDENPGAWARAQAEALGVPLVQIAREARVDYTTIYRWEQKKTQPYWDSVERVKRVIESYWARIEKETA